MEKGKMDQYTNIIVFHSFPRKPCIDGLMSAIIVMNHYQSISSADEILIVPYWRTKESFEKVKSAVESTITSRYRIVYVDCTPDLEEEVNYLLEILSENNEVVVYDHHPRKNDSPIKKLIGKPNFNFVFDPENCGALMVHRLLSDKEQTKLDVSDLLTIIQFSEYEGMNASVAGKENADLICRNAFEEVKRFTTDTHIVENIDILSKNGLALFYILDQILSKEDDWKFLTDNGLSHKDKFLMFKQKSKDYLETSKRVVSGKDLKAFSRSIIKDYIDSTEKLPTLFSAGKIIKQQQVGDQSCDILAVNISIFDYGRCLEPLFVKALKERNASFGILMNEPSIKPDGSMSYYFSLRRVSSEFDARDLAKFIMDFTGTKIGGGHPWASGVTLDQKQYEKFKTLYL